MLGPLAGAPHVDGLLGAVPGAIRPRHDHGAAGVGDQTDVQDVEGPHHGAGVEHVLHGERIAIARLRVEGRPLARGHRHLGPLLEGRAVLVHVARGDQAEVGRRAAEAVRHLELAGQRGVAPRGDPDARAARLAVGDDRHVAEAVVQGEHGVAGHDDERAAAHRGAVDVARDDADGLGDGGRRVLPGGEHAVDVADLEAGVAHGVGMASTCRVSWLLLGSVPISSLSSTPTMQVELESSFIFARSITVPLPRRPWPAGTSAG